MAFRSGFVSIIGRPNAGKSTLLNALVGQKLAIVTHKPQTTRARVQGMVNVRARKGRPAGQIVFIDTPGVLRPDNSLDRKMMQEVREALESRDLVLLIVDATARFGAGDQHVLELVKQAGGPVFLLLNKIDLVNKADLLPMIDRYRQLHDFQEIIPISAAKKQGLDELLDAVIRVLPEGPQYYPGNQVTDQPERHLAAELIREQVLIATAQEVPYATTVVVEQWEEEPKLTHIAAAIYCERDGQKAIIIGKRGQMLKHIGTKARLELEKLFRTKVFLELFVKVRPGWRESKGFVESLDWRRQLEEMAARTPEDEPET